MEVAASDIEIIYTCDWAYAKGKCDKNTFAALVNTELSTKYSEDDVAWELGRWVPSLNWSDYYISWCPTKMPTQGAHVITFILFI